MPSVGGYRLGSGRKKGSANKKNRAICEKARAEGITPLEVMMQLMRQYVDAKDLVSAAAIAKDAAPYMHPRLTAVDASVRLSIIDEMSDAEQRSLAASLAALARDESEAAGGVETTHH